MSNETTNDQEILDRFVQVVVGSLRIDAAKVTPGAYLDDLGAESLDLMQITMDVEEEFNILIPQKNILQTAQEIIGEGVFVRDRKVTEQGIRLIRTRLPELAAGPDNELSVNDLNRMFMRVGAWVRMISRLMDHTPKACPQCGLAFGKQVAGRLKCKSCAAEHDIPSGDDLNRDWVREYCQGESLLVPPRFDADSGAKR